MVLPWNISAALHGSVNASSVGKEKFCRDHRDVSTVDRTFRLSPVRFSASAGCRVKNGTVSYSKPFYRHRERVEYTCSNRTDEFALMINSTLRCFNGNLTGEPSCPASIRTSCIVPPMLFLRNIANTSIPSGTSVDLGSSFTYQCMPDHPPAMDSALAESQIDGKWSHYAQCHPIACKEHPPSIDHGRMIFRSTVHGSIARYRCFPGYQIDLNSTLRLTCQYGQWTPKALPRCLPSKKAMVDENESEGIDGSFQFSVRIQVHSSMVESLSS